MKILIELGFEELPAWPLLKELNNILPKWKNSLEKYNFSAEFSLEYTPRRLVLSGNLPEFASDNEIEYIGAPKNIAIDKDNNWSKAALAFAKKCNISEKELQFKKINEKEVLYYKSLQKGNALKDVLQNILNDFLASLNFAKVMRWGANEFEFIRPLRNLICMLEDELLDIEIFGVKSNKACFVHRDFGYEKKSFNTQAQYYEILKNNAVILQADKRKNIILEQFKNIEKNSGFKIELDEELLAEVVAITEYPNAYIGEFDKNFLEVPAEVIITSMKENQRYFALYDKNNKLTNHFVVVTNSTSKDSKLIIAGNEKVLKARLSDAQFFWHSDLKSEFNAQKLKNITYLAGLGSMFDKELREVNIAKILADIYQDNLKALNVDIEMLTQAIMLSKADLSTSMVYEFTNLQGIMGSYYAQFAGKNELICKSIKEQYLPNSEESELPSNIFSSIVALANKFDTLMSLFSIGKIPNGTKDPYALRRAGLGIIKIILNLNKNLDIKEFLNSISKEYKNFDIDILRNFIFERIYSVYENINPSLIKACINANKNDLVRLNANILALDEIVKQKDFEINFATFKRLANILKDNYNFKKVDENLFVAGSEKKLYLAFKACKLDKNNPKEYLQELFSLKKFIDEFFDNVMINDENLDIRANRFALVGEIYQTFLQIADIKEISF